MLVEIVGRGKTRLPRTFVEHHLSVFTIPGSEATKQKKPVSLANLAPRVSLFLPPLFLQEAGRRRNLVTSLHTYHYSRWAGRS